MPKTRTSTWVVGGVILAAALLLGLFALGLIGLETGFLGFVLGFVMATIPVPFYMAFTLWIDRFEPEPPWLLALAFVWGAAIAVFFSLVFNTINGMIFTALAGAARGETLAAVLSAPLVEELAKGAALFLLFLWQRKEFDNVTDGIVYATMVGLGFAMTENIQYYGRAVAESGIGAAGVFFVRGIMGPFCHPLFTSMTGIGLGAARESDRKAVKLIAPVVGLGLAMLLHFIWNLSASLGAAFFVAYFLVMVPAFLTVGGIALFSLRREAKIIRNHLEKVVADGVLSRDDLIVVTSAIGRLRATGRAFSEGGFPKWSLRKRLHGLATELAFHSWRSSREADADAQATHAELVAEIRAVRSKLGLPTEIVPPEPELVARLTREIPLPVLPAVSPAGSAALVCTSGPLQGQSFMIGYTGLQIGRDAASAQIVVKHPSVSKRHAWVGFANEGVMAIDHGSTNGTWLNGERIREARLQPGDRLEISDQAAIFELRLTS
jgi:RsiW-degrading membrane proteinase PrsW (M82 family)